MSGHSMGSQEAETGSEVGVTLTADRFMGDWRTRLTNNTAVLFAVTGTMVLATLNGALNIPYAIQHGEALKTFEAAILTAAPAAIGYIAAKRAWNIGRHLDRSE